jgi:hypothetical protein
MFASDGAKGMLNNVCEFLSHHPIYGTDAASLETWRRDCEHSWRQLSTEFLNKNNNSRDCLQGEAALHTALDAIEQFAREVALHRTDGVWPSADRHARIEALLNKPQIQQRTEEWYADAIGVLSASQFSIILKAGRTRALVVKEKAEPGPFPIENRRTVVLTEELNPFTWGIRFEPIVKMIYEAITKSRVVDLGRLKHQNDPRLAASPDGLVCESADPVRLGRFVEFKAPVSRVLNGSVPDDYMAQMQIQMEVGDVEECDYLEVKFQSGYGPKPCAPVPEGRHPEFFGELAVIVRTDTGQPVRYEYSPLNTTQWSPTPLGLQEHVIQIVPWWCDKYWLHTVGRSRTWFQSVQPAIEQFWLDVAAAKAGTFVVPESKRKPREVKCLIDTSA